MTVVFGKEKGGYARGVGSGVTYKKYFHLPRSKQSSDERLALLQCQLDNERRERVEKEEEIKNLSDKVVQTQGMVTQLMSQLAAQGEKLHLLSTQLPASEVSQVDINPKAKGTVLEGVTPLTVVGCNKDASFQESNGPATPLSVVGCEKDAIFQKSNGLATLEKERETMEIHNSVGSNKMSESQQNAFPRREFQSQENPSPTLVLPQERKCRLWHLKRTSIIALGTAYMSDGKQMLHNKLLPKDCYRVSIDKSLVDAACIPDVGNNGFKIVKDAVGGFFAWPKNQVILDEKVTPQTCIQNIGENKTAPKLQNKRKATFVSCDTIQKQARANLKSQKYLNLRFLNV